jgi:hypothetical protein
MDPLGGVIDHFARRHRVFRVSACARVDADDHELTRHQNDQFLLAVVVGRMRRFTSLQRGEMALELTHGRGRPLINRMHLEAHPGIIRESQ